MVGPLLLSLLLFTGQGLAEKVEDVRHALTSIGIEDSFSDCAREHPAPKKLLANFLFHADGRLELVSTEPAVSPELFTCFQEASANLELDPPGQSFAIAYPMEQAGDEGTVMKTEAEKAEGDAEPVPDQGPGLKAGKALYAFGLVASLLGAGGLVASHILLHTRPIDIISTAATMTLSYGWLLAGTSLSLYGLRMQQEALLKAGGTMERKYFRQSLVTFLTGAGLSALMLLAFNLDLIYVSLESICSEDAESCDEEKQESNEKVLKGIAIGLAASQAVLLISIIPMAVMQSVLTRKRRSLKKKDLAMLPFVSYGFLSSRQAHVLSFTWAF